MSNKDFFNAMRKSELSVTENGGLGLKSTGSDMLDFMWKVPSFRNNGISEKDISMFQNILEADPVLATKFAFMIRDTRGGMGERDLFRKLIPLIKDKFLKDGNLSITEFIKLIPEYGRWDDTFIFSEFNDASNFCFSTVLYNQLIEDTNRMEENKPISLLAKWIPSVNSKNVGTRKFALKLCDMLFNGTATKNQKVYRQTMSKLRKYIETTEVTISANKWSEVNYSKVPSLANKKYSDAFYRHDEERRKEYIESVRSGKATMNTGRLTPHQIVDMVVNSRGWEEFQPLNDNQINEVNTMWEQYIKSKSNLDHDVLVVRDGSGSMWCPCGNSSAINIGDGLTLFFAEKNKNEFRNKFITFSSRPELVDVSKCNSFVDKVKYLRKYNDCSNTDIQKVFELILHTAKMNKMTQDDMPRTVLIISDMEFDPYWHNASDTIFYCISKDYEDAGFKLPHLVFWNVNSRTNTIPMTENELGVTLLSGYSIDILDMVMSDKIDPLEALLEKLNGERYKAVEAVVVKR